MKGTFDGICNRGVCNETRDIRWFNSGTQFYYCADCMIKITYWPENANLFTKHTEETKIPNHQLGYGFRTARV